MELLKKEAQNIEKEIEQYQNEYAEECVKLYNTEGYDSYKPKWQKKIESLAKKYADLILPLTKRHQQICDEIEVKLEEKRKSKFKDTF